MASGNAVGLTWKQTVARFVLGMDFDPLSIPELACQLLQEGHDTQGLRLLAGESRPTEVPLIEPFRRVLSEIGLLPMAPETAAVILACEVARDIVAGTMTPHDGIHRIWSLVAAVPAVRCLPAFGDIEKTSADMWYYWPYHEDKYSALVRQYAEAILVAHDAGAAKQPPGDPR